MATLPEPVERVARVLRDSGTEGRVEEFPMDTPTAEDAARAAGTTLEQIVKSLVFICDGKYVLAMVPGDKRADGKRVAEAAGAKKARVAGAEQVEEATGFTPGAVAPFPLRKVETVLIERRLLVHPLVWVGGGSHRHLVQIAPGDLIALTKARPADLVERDL